jgi:hypothetical protein
MGGLDDTGLGETIKVDVKTAVEGAAPTVGLLVWLVIYSVVVSVSVRTMEVLFTVSVVMVQTVSTVLYKM